MRPEGTRRFVHEGRVVAAPGETRPARPDRRPRFGPGTARRWTGSGRNAGPPRSTGRLPNPCFALRVGAAGGGRSPRPPARVAAAFSTLAARLPDAFFEPDTAIRPIRPIASPRAASSTVAMPGRTATRSPRETKRARRSPPGPTRSSRRRVPAAGDPLGITAASSPNGPRRLGPGRRGARRTSRPPRSTDRRHRTARERISARGSSPPAARVLAPTGRGSRIAALGLLGGRTVRGRGDPTVPGPACRFLCSPVPGRGPRNRIDHATRRRPTSWPARRILSTSSTSGRRGARPRLARVAPRPPNRFGTHPGRKAGARPRRPRWCPRGPRFGARTPGRAARAGRPARRRSVRRAGAGSRHRRVRGPRRPARRVRTRAGSPAIASSGRRFARFGTRCRAPGALRLRGRASSGRHATRGPAAPIRVGGRSAGAPDRGRTADAATRRRLP